MLIGFFFFKLNSSTLYIKSDILLYDLSILLVIKSISFLSISICRSEKLFNNKANIKSSSGGSIFAKIQFFALDLISFKLKLISLIGFN